LSQCESAPSSHLSNTKLLALEQDGHAASLRIWQNGRLQLFTLPPRATEILRKYRELPATGRLINYVFVGKASRTRDTEGEIRHHTHTRTSRQRRYTRCQPTTSSLHAQNPQEREASITQPNNTTLRLETPKARLRPIRRSLCLGVLAGHPVDPRRGRDRHFGKLCRRRTRHPGSVHVAIGSVVFQVEASCSEI